MAAMKTFGDYMYHLLHAPLKKVKKEENQLYIFFKVAGKLFDDSKANIFSVREMGNLISAKGIVLDWHGIDRKMPRFDDEHDDYYRKRLMLKKVIAEKAGSNEGILYALRSLGYEKSEIYPFYKIDPERWSEFVVFLNSDKPSLVNDIDVIDQEVMNVKLASSMPNYGIKTESEITLNPRVDVIQVEYPVCGELICGTYPPPES
jgi:hypothetical protein